MIEAGLVSLLNGTSAITNLCAGRIYPVVMPELGQPPCIVYQLVSSVSQYSNDGPSGFVTARMQLTAWAASYADAKALDAAVRAALDGYTGTLPDGTDVANVLIDNGLDYYEKDSRLFRVSTDYRVLYSQQ